MIFAENDQLAPYGKGWMWDDYNTYYQVEMSSFPAYGNILLVNKDSFGIYAEPKRMFSQSKRDSTIQIIKRAQFQNTFNVPTDLEYFEEFYQQIPYFLPYFRV